MAVAFPARTVRAHGSDAAHLCARIGAGFIFGGGTNAPAPSAIEMTGMLRVYLKSAGRPGFSGHDAGRSYTVEGDRGFRFERDTAIVLAADGESVLLSVGGLTIDMGPHR